MIKILPVIAIVAVSIYLFMKAFDCLVETAIYFHSLYKSWLVFDDYEAELLQTGMETDAAVEVRLQLAKDLAKYDRLTNVHPWRYRFWRLVYGENKFVKAVAMDKKAENKDIL